MSEDARDYCQRMAREGDRDAYLAALFAPEPARGDLWALQAFAHELARIAPLVSEPMLGEIRLQWWREAMERLFTGRIDNHPVIAALAAAHARTPFAQAPFETLMDARSRDFDPAPFDSLEALTSHAQDLAGSLFALSFSVLAPGRDLTPLAQAAGRALILARAAQGLFHPHTDLPAALVAAEARHALEEARARLSKDDAARLRPALLPLALIERDLRTNAKRGAPVPAGSLLRLAGLLAAALRPEI